MRVKAFMLVLFLAGGSSGAESVMERATGLAQRGRIEEALKLVNDPANSDERILCARLLDYDGNPIGAIETLKAGIGSGGDDLSLFAELITLYQRMGEDGPTVSYKRGSVCYSPSKDEAAESQFKTNHFELAVQACDKALMVDSAVEYFQYQKAVSLVGLGKGKEALSI